MTILPHSNESYAAYYTNCNKKHVFSSVVCIVNICIALVAHTAKLVALKASAKSFMWCYRWRLETVQ